MLCFAMLPSASAIVTTKGKTQKKSSLPDLVPLFRTSRWSEAVATAVILDVLRNVLPRQLAAARAVVGTLAAIGFRVGDAAAEQASL